MTGRPMVYADLILSLEDEELWSHKCIAEYGMESGLFEAGRKKAMLDALSKYSRRKLPSIPDGWRVKGAVHRNGWYGWRWKSSLSQQYGSQEQRANWERLRTEDMERRALLAKPQKSPRLWLILASIVLALLFLLLAGGHV